MRHRLAGLFLVFCSLVLVGLVVLHTPWFNHWARSRITAAVSRATGGRAALDALDFDIFTLRVRLEGFTLRGKELPAQQPLFSARSIDAQLSLLPVTGSRIHLSSVRLEQPQVHIYVRPDGSTNLPEPPVPRRAGTPADDLIRLRIGEINLHRSHFEFDSRPIDFNVRIEDFALRLSYERRKARYGVELSAGAVHLPARLAPAVRMEAWLEGDRIEIVSATARQGDSRAEWSGAVGHFKHPSVDLEYKTSVLLGDIELSPVRQGFAVAAGRLHYDPAGGLRLDGEARAEQVALSARNVQVRRLNAAGAFTLTPHLLHFDALLVESPYGRWRGSLVLADWRRIEMRGQALSLDLANLQAALLDQKLDWNASISGPIAFSARLAAGGPTGARLDAGLTVTPAEGSVPLSGKINLTWLQECSCIRFGTSSLATPSARAVFEGTLGERLDAGLFATRLDELAPVITLLGRGRPFEMPVSLDQGTVRVQAAITGPLDAPHIRAAASATNAIYEELRFDRADAEIDLDRARLEVSSFSLRQEAGQLSGSFALGLDGWRPSGSRPMQAAIEVDRADVSRLLRLAHMDADAHGAAVGSIRLAGTPDAPQGRLQLDVASAAWKKEKLGRITADVALDGGGAVRGRLTRAETQVTLAGAWTHPAGKLRDGDVRLRAGLVGFRTRDWAAFRGLPLSVEATFGAEVQFSLHLQDARVALTSLDGTLAAPEFAAGAQRFGALHLAGKTRQGVLALRCSLGGLPGKIGAEARVALSGRFPVEGRAHYQGVTTAALEQLLADAGAAGSEHWPFSGSFDVEAEFRGRLDEPSSVAGNITIGRLEFRPAGGELAENRRLAGDLTLRNSGPLLFLFDSKSVRVSAAQLTALDTDLTLSGSYDLASSAPWNLEARGTANLAVLGSFYPGLVASGSGRLRAVIRGASAEPQLNGQMEIVKAAFFLKDIPNGIENVNGTIFFEKNRANIQKLTGISGGGSVALTGFAGFGRGDLAYRLQAAFSNVRVRYPEGVSNTLDANLTLTGSLDSSVLAGVITVKRSGFVVSGDLASMVGNAGNPIPAAAVQNEFLRNLQFDLRIRTAPDAVFVTSYTSDLQTEADLRLRGSPSKPVLLGSINANQGQVNFFGNRYTISRGEILFFNTATVLPQIDLDLETRVRGITVYMNVSGPLSRLNVTYRSEPPLQSSEILALLTVGRTPASTSTSIVTSERIRSQTVMENSAGSNTLLGGALTAGLNSRTERFFGASRLRIDPSAVGVDNLPQARLSIEQSISRDVTVTFITNLNRSQQQVVRLEWDLSRRWSLIAIKDENGAFAVDFLFRKRFR